MSRFCINLIIIPGLFIACLVSGSSAQAQPVMEIQQLLAFDGAAGDEFGFEAASAPARIVIGAPGDADGGTQSGAAYMFKVNLDGTWSFQQKILPSDIMANWFFGIELAISTGFGPGANLMAAGVKSENTFFNSSGAVYIYSEGPFAVDPWVLNKKIFSPNPEFNGAYGQAVDIENDLLLVGAPGEGLAYIHQRHAGGSNNWGSIATLTPPAPVFNVSAESVGISGDVAIVSDRGDNSAGSESGAAFIYTKDAGGLNNWGFTKKLQATIPSAQDLFGISVDISGDFVVVGAQGDDGQGNNDGAAYLFMRDEGGADNWGVIKRLTAPDGYDAQFFGREVAIDGDLVLVGTYSDHAEGNNAGAAYVFGRNVGGADNWGLLQKLVASDAMAGDFFAQGIALTGEYVTCGVRLDDDNGMNSGSARVFTINSLCPQDLNGDGVVDTADLGILLGSFGMSGIGDLNLDGVIDTADLGLLIAGFSATDCIP